MKKMVLLGVIVGCSVLASCGKEEGEVSLPTPALLTSAPTQGVLTWEDPKNLTPSIEPSTFPSWTETTIQPTVIPDAEKTEETLDVVETLKKEYGFTTIGTVDSGWVSVPGICHPIAESSDFYVREDGSIYYSFIRNRMALADAKEYVLKSIRGQYSGVEVEEMDVADFGSTLPGYVFSCTTEDGDNSLCLVCLCMKNQDGTTTIMLATASGDYALGDEVAMYVSTYLEPTKALREMDGGVASNPDDGKGNVTTQVEEGESRLVLGDSSNGFLDLGEGFSYDGETGKYVEKHTKVTVDMRLNYTDAGSLAEAEQAWWESEGVPCSSSKVTVGGLKGQRLTIREGESCTVLLFLPFGDGIAEVIEITGKRADVDPVVTDVCINYQQPEEFPRVPEIDFSRYQKIESTRGVTKIPIGNTAAELEGDWYLTQREDILGKASITGYTSREGSITVVQADEGVHLPGGMGDDTGFIFDRQSYTDSAGNEVSESKYYLQETGLVIVMLDVTLKDSPSTSVHVSASRGDAALWLMRLFGTARQQ